MTRVIANELAVDENGVSVVAFGKNRSAIRGVVVDETNIFKGW